MSLSLLEPFLHSDHRRSRRILFVNSLHKLSAFFPRSVWMTTLVTRLPSLRTYVLKILMTRILSHEFVRRQSGVYHRCVSCFRNIFSVQWYLGFQDKFPVGSKFQDLHGTCGQNQAFILLVDINVL